uniref:Uncharacterized protein n=1 Tax=Setaria italica TaxID=4555 RepID=K3Z1Z7_SETIT
MCSGRAYIQLHKGRAYIQLYKGLLDQRCTSALLHRL